MIVDSKTCLANFVRYEKENKKKAPKNVFNKTVLQGMPGEPGYVHPAKDDGFADAAVKVPKGFKRVPVKQDWLKMTDMCRAAINDKQLAKLSAGGKDWRSWWAASQKYWMTIADVERIPPGKTIDACFLHRNVWDTTMTPERRGKLHKPSTFFAEEKARFAQVHRYTRTSRKTTPLEGQSMFVEYESEPKPFEFEIEYAKGKWYPLSKGVLPAKDSQGAFKLLGTAKHWSEFPKTTHVGWRGPMIAWENLDKLPKIYFT